MERIELITSKEYWFETLELMQMQGHTDYDIATVIANKMEEAMNYIPCCKSDSDVVADIRNKLGSVTALIDLIKLRKTEHADYAESKLDAQILQAIESIKYIKQL